MRGSLLRAIQTGDPAEIPINLDIFTESIQTGERELNNLSGLYIYMIEGDTAVQFK